jgi:uncharacterized alkaline shock family protein YloU
MAQADLKLPFRGTDLSGGITISSHVIAKLASQAARATYGVVAMQETSIKKLTRYFMGSLSEGVELEVGDGCVDIGLHVVMERGVNIAQVTANLQEQVRYQVERVGGVPVGDISVRVEDLQD